VAKHELTGVNTVYRVLRVMAEPARKYDPEKNADRERQMDEAVAMYEAGVMIRTIVSETGIPQPTLHHELHRRQVPLRSPRSKSTNLKTSEEIEIEKKVRGDA
jgi:hypothetical protein